MMDEQTAAARAPRRIAVVGTTGSGKTTLARRLAERLGVPHIELDALFWGPDWTPVEGEVFLARIRSAIAAERWVSDGNYVGSTDAMLWTAADTLVWLDYSIARIYRQLFVRTTTRSINKVELWSGNTESLRKGFMSRDSLFVWALKSHWRHRREWVAKLTTPEFAHLRVVRLRSPRATEAYVRQLVKEPARA